jgi:hypothetical protein
MQAEIHAEVTVALENIRTAVDKRVGLRDGERADIKPPVDHTLAGGADHRLQRSNSDAPTRQ